MREVQRHGPVGRRLGIEQARTTTGHGRGEAAIGPLPFRHGYARTRTQGQGAGGCVRRAACSVRAAGGQAIRVDTDGTGRARVAGRQGMGGRGWGGGKDRGHADRGTHSTGREGHTQQRVTGCVCPLSGLCVGVRFVCLCVCFCVCCLGVNLCRDSPRSVHRGGMTFHRGWQGTPGGMVRAGCAACDGEPGLTGRIHRGYFCVLVSFMYINQII